MSAALYVATTKHQQEVRAAEELRDQGYRVWLPLRFHQALAARRVVVASELRFSGYIFVEFDIDKQEHGPINNTRNVGELILTGERPAALPASWEGDMRLHIDMEYEKVTGKSKPDPRADLHHGDIVRIDRRGHAAHGMEAEYSRTERGLAVVTIGWAVWKLPEIDLTLVRKWNEKGVAA